MREQESNRERRRNFSDEQREKEQERDRERRRNFTDEQRERAQERDRERQPRPQGFSLKNWVGREKALASAGHVSPRTP